MKRMYRVAALAAVAAGAIATPGSASHSWKNYRWALPNSGEVNAPILDAVDSRWDSYLVTAVQDWNVSTRIESPGPTASNADPKKCSAVRGSILVCNAAYGRRGWLGIATVWTNTDGTIVQGTTKLNDSYFDSATYNHPKWREMVTCQEVGHDYGLAHQDENFNNGNLGSCMDYTNDPDLAGSNGPNNRHPNQHDYDQLLTIYGGSSTNFGSATVGQGTKAAAPRGAAGDSPAEWGSAVGYDAHGRPNVYEQHLANGYRKITHVLWAIGEGPRGGHQNHDHEE